MPLKENTVQAKAREQRQKVFAERATEGSKAAAEYRQNEQAVRDLTAKLRAERLARESAARKTKPVAEPARRAKRAIAR